MGKWYLICSHCDNPISHGDRFCCWCSKPIDSRLQRRSVACPSCAKITRPWGRFCSACGNPIHDAKPVPFQPSALPEEDSSLDVIPKEEDSSFHTIDLERLTRSLTNANGRNGELLVSRYRLVERLAGGGMGEAYKAHDINTGNSVCLKKLRAGIDTRVLRQEADALKKLEHRNIVNLLEVILTSTPPIIVMEFVPGQTLQEFMRIYRSLPEVTVVPIAIQLFDAVRYAHENGVIHRDLKPSNIIAQLAEESVVLKILDFGLALVNGYDDQSRLTALGAAAGTPAYMAPEQFNRELLDEACDIYALGQILWELLAGRPAFRGGIDAIFLDKLKMDGLNVKEVVPEASEAIAHFIMHCTRRSRSDRLKAAEAYEILMGMQELQSTDDAALDPFATRPGPSMIQ